MYTELIGKSAVVIIIAIIIVIVLFLFSIENFENHTEVKDQLKTDIFAIRTIMDTEMGYLFDKHFDKDIDVLKKNNIFQFNGVTIGNNIYILVDGHKYSTILFVTLHELTHVLYGDSKHSPEFWINFKKILKLSYTLNQMPVIDYSITPISYGSIDITNNPYLT